MSLQRVCSAAPLSPPTIAISYSPNTWGMAGPMFEQAHDFVIGTMNLSGEQAGALDSTAPFRILLRCADHDV